MTDMPDISALVDSVLADPNAMEQLKAVAQSMGIGDMLPQQTENQAPTVVQNPMLSGIGEMLPLLNSIGKEDDSTRLLKALRPFLGEERKAKLDEASKLIMIFKVLSLAREGNIL